MIKIAKNLLDMRSHKAASLEEDLLVPITNPTSLQPINYLASAGLGGLLGGTAGAGVSAIKSLIKGEEGVPKDLLKYIIVGSGLGGVGGLIAKPILDARSPYLSAFTRYLRQVPAPVDGRRR